MSAVGGETRLGRSRCGRGPGVEVQDKTGQVASARAGCGYPCPGLGGLQPCNRLDGFHVQYNVVCRETLIDAQLHPEKHRDLIVRVAGYSAFFNVLSKQTQDDIIARTEQSL